MSDWKCGKCDVVYPFEQFIKLKLVPARPKEDPECKIYGKVAVCPCGYTFHKDKWLVRKPINLKFGKIKVRVFVSTVFLELEHPGGYYYETMVFPQEKRFRCYYSDRYRTKEEAKTGHKELIKKLKKGLFGIRKIKGELEEYQIEI